MIIRKHLGLYGNITEPGEADNPAIKDSKSIKSKEKITGKTVNNANTKDVEIAVY